MDNSARYSLGIGLLIALLITSCSSINVKAAWKDPAYQSHPKKVLVIGLSNNPVLRRVFEDEFAEQIKAQGTNAIASYTVLPDMEKNDHAVIDEKVMELKADTVLITRLASKKTTKIYVGGNTFSNPPYYDRWHNFYNYGNQIIRTPGYVIEEEFALIESIMYDTPNDNLIWAAWSEAGIAGANQKLIKSYIKAMVKNMVNQNLLGK